jgi:hypothetical protein
METTSVKEQILKSIRESLIEKDEETFSDKFEITPEEKPNPDEFPDLAFAQKFSEKGGNFHLCTNGKELVEKISSFFHEKKLNTIFCNNNDLGELLEVCGVTAYDKTITTSPYDFMIMPVDFLISETGGVIISSKTSSLENILEKTRHLVLIALSNQVKNNNIEALKLLAKNNKNVYPAQTLILPNPSLQGRLKITLFLRYVA